MSGSGSEWGIRNILAPVITRLLIYETNPIDIERVVSNVEKVDLTNVRVLEENWLSNWQEKAKRYLKLAESAERDGHRLTVKDLYMYAAQCYYAVFLINFADVNDKKENYFKYVKYYQKATSYYEVPVKRIHIKFENDTAIPAYLHLPKGEGPFPCTIILSGAGSCKEEMNILARPLVDRGIAVLVPDLPGVGESLYVSNLKCRWELIERAFDSIYLYAKTNKSIISENIGCAGLCMGGGFAYRLVSKYKEIKYLATLFPLFINVAAESAPLWMRQGKWYKTLVGDVKVEEYIQEMSLEKNETVSCPYFFIHGKNDNWMSLDDALQLYKRAKGEKQQLIIEDEAVFYSGVKVVHAMPVGEQMHWVKHAFADWIKKHS